MTILHRAQLQIFADYNQFYLWDAGTNPSAPEDWSDIDVTRAVKVADHVVVVCPIRNMTVPVEVEVRTHEPTDELAAHDHVVVCGLHLPTGAFQVHECTGGEHLLLSIPPGHYSVLVLFSRLGSLSEDGLDGEDRYRVVLWPGPSRPLAVLKQWTGQCAG